MITENTISLVGRLGQDPELRVTPTGKEVLTMSLATDRPAQGGGRKTDWHKVIVWEPPQILKDCRKGDALYVRGRLHYEEWEAKDGSKRRSAEVVADRVITFGVLPQGATLGTAQDMPATRPPATGGPVDDEEDLPF